MSTRKKRHDAGEARRRVSYDWDVFHPRARARLMTVMREALIKGDARMMAAIEADIPSPVAARDLVLHFQAMVRSRTI